jgi:uncharacterized protein (DUF1800 family)
MVQDPALLMWLDAGRNKRQSPNENLSREVMELFTLGRGFFSEEDVREGARALTGWQVNTSLTKLCDGDLAVRTDSRSVYATLLEDVLDTDAGAVLSDVPERLPLIR